MRQVSQNYRTGKIRVEEADAPGCGSGGVLVQTAFSVVSAGTEGMKVREGRMSLIGKAMARPDQVKKVLRTLRQQGPQATFQKVMNRLDSLTPLGYSLAGTLLEVGAGAAEFQRGQRVACAGAEYAHHAEVVFVPRNLVVPVPEGVALHHAAFATVGAIALHGFRRSELQLGETAGVIGLGLLGQILVRILKAAGVGAVGVDVSPERCRLAVAGGAAAAALPDDPRLGEEVRSLTAGRGVDAVFVTAGGDSNSPIELAVEIARDRARVVEIGKTRVDIPWNDYYQKELEVRFSRSYGPGRYDPVYEEDGVDYPAGYVRWTERRNMAAFLELVAQRRIDLDPIITSIHPFEEAEQVYQAMAEGRAGGLGMLFRYAEPAATPAPPLQPPPERPAKPTDKARIGVIGAGNYSSTMLLPHLAANPRVRLVAVATRSSLTALNACRRFPFERHGTDARALLGSGDIDAVVIATRHSSHASLAAAALEAGLAVFVEKPLAIDRTGAERVRQAIASSGNDRLMVGFNRRFAPLLVELRDFFSPRSGPLFMSYRVHAGQLEAGSWYLRESEGSRFVGEGGHFLDVFAFLTGARPTTVSAASLRPASSTPDDRDNVAVTVTYEDGSVGSLLYLTQGGRRVPKEHLEVFGGGRTAQLDNFALLHLYSADGKRTRRARPDKGQAAEMSALVQTVCAGSAPPVGVECLFDTTLATLAVDLSLRRGAPVPLADFWVRGDEPGSLDGDGAAEAGGKADGLE